MLRAMAKQAEAEREKRSKIIHAEGEFNAAQKLVDAAALLATQPMTLQLRYLQTLTEIGVEKNTTIVFPLPMEMLTLLNKDQEPLQANESIPKPSADAQAPEPPVSPASDGTTPPAADGGANPATPSTPKAGQNSSPTSSPAVAPAPAAPAQAPAPVSPQSLRREMDRMAGRRRCRPQPLLPRCVPRCQAPQISSWCRLPQFRTLTMPACW
jgi:hypothetical protein